MPASISERVFGHLNDGTEVKRFTLTNERGTRAQFSSLGAAWFGFQRPEDSESLVLGCDTVKAQLSQRGYIGATVGRFANRIAHGRLLINNEPVQLEVNLPPHHIHGGTVGLADKVWDSHITLKDDRIPTLTLSCQSPDGENGYPGNVRFMLTITLTEDDCVRFEYHAKTDATTPISLTNHAYFNLNGETAGRLHEHAIKVDSDRFLEADEQALPTGAMTPTGGTGLDFSNWTDITQRLTAYEDERLERAGGVDHCFCFDQDRAFRRLAAAQSRTSNVQLECWSDLPGMQLYTANFLGGSPKNSDYRFERHGAFCFEPGFWPDSPNHAHFPDCMIDPDKPYSAIIEYSFKTINE